MAGASKILVDFLYHYKDYGLSVGTMICGWDKTGPQIYYVDNDGTRLKADERRSYFSVGSRKFLCLWCIGSIVSLGYDW